MDCRDVVLMFCVDAKTITRTKMIKVENQVSVAWGRFIWGENCTRGWDISVQREKPPALAPAPECTATLSRWNVMCYWFEVADLYQPKLTGVFVSLQDESASSPALCVSLCCSDPSSLLIPPPPPLPLPQGNLSCTITECCVCFPATYCNVYFLQLQLHRLLFFFLP